jgi:hypothetical protein
MVMDLTIVGSFISILLVVNAFFIKSLVASIQQLEVKMTTIAVQHDHTIADVRDNKSRILELERETARQRERLHSLEGASSQVLEFIKEQ